MRSCHGIAWLVFIVCVCSSWADISISRFEPDRPIFRAQRVVGVSLVVENTGDTPVSAEVSLVLQEGVHLKDAPSAQSLTLDARSKREVTWSVEFDVPGTFALAAAVRAGNAGGPTATLTLNVLPPVEVQKLPYIPDPVPVKTEILVGAHNCPLWEADKPNMWAQVLKHPERTPALGFYSQENPEVADWETKWAVEHGVNFFIYCWYRASQGGPVEMNFSSAIHDALFKSKFGDIMNFTIMWENQSRGRAGVSDEKDLMGNLLPFWIENYFKRSNYLKIDNKPLLFIYRPEFLIDDLGSEENVVKAFDLMRQACKDAGFDGLYILGEYRGLDAEHLKLMRRIGLDYTFAYVWYVPDNPTPAKAIEAQVDYITKTQQIGIIPQVVTVSQAWSGWHDEGTIWKIPPDDFKTLLGKAKDIIATFPATELGSKMLLLDNWNEWSEGHYLAPYREYGFGYLDAVREVFATMPPPHVDLLPEDIGMGPYDTAYKEHVAREQALKGQLAKHVIKGDTQEPGLIGWWAFDEDLESPIAMDYSGHCLGGKLQNARRTQGIDGNALVCEGGSVEVPNDPRLSPKTALTVECWVKTDVAGQQNTWCVNRVFGGGTSTGYRLGVLDGKPCFEVPLTDWSHHLTAKEPLPTGRWVHLAGTFDGQMLRIYVDGEEEGVMERPGPVHPNAFPLVLGNFAVGHQSHFEGLLDEVRLYDRALSQDEVRTHFLQFKK